MHRVKVNTAAFQHQSGTTCHILKQKQTTFKQPKVCLTFLFIGVLWTHRTRDTSAPVPKCPDTSTPRHFGPKAVRTIGPDTSVLGPRYFSISAYVEVSSYCDIRRNITHCKQCRCLRCLLYMHWVKFNTVNRYPCPNLLHFKTFLK